MVTIDVTPYCGASFIKNIEQLAIEMYKNRKQQICLSLEYEGFDITHNGLENAVKNIADIAGIPYNQISFLSSDRLAKSNIFKCEYIGWNDLFTALKNNPVHAEIHFPEQKTYCQLIGRADNNRMYGHYRHTTYKHKDKGLATFHHDPKYYNDTDVECLDFVLEYNKEYKQMHEDLPYSDVGEYIKPPIIFGNMEDAEFWNTLYKNISMELAYETITTSKTFYLTEKTIRPMQYGKLFMIAAGKYYEKYLEELGFDIFSDVIDKSYDKEEAYIRIDMMYNSLTKFLTSNFDCNSLTERLQYNQKLVMDLSE